MADLFRDWWLVHRLEVYLQLALAGVAVVGFFVHALVTLRRKK